MATHSSILAWRISWTEEPGGLQFINSERVRHDWVTEHTLFVGTCKTPGRDWVYYSGPKSRSQCVKQGGRKSREWSWSPLFCLCSLTDSVFEIICNSWYWVNSWDSWAWIDNLILNVNPLCDPTDKIIALYRVSFHPGKSFFWWLRLYYWV